MDFRREFSLFSLAQKMTHMTCLNIVLTFPKVTRIICHPLSPIKKSQEICQSRQVRGHGFRREFSLFSLAQKMTHMTCLNIVLTFPKVTRIICHPLSPIKKSQEICQSRQVRGHGFRREFSLFSLAQKMTHMTCLNIVLTFPKVTRIICHPLSPIKKSQEICQSRQVRGHGFRREFSLFSLAQKMTHMTCLNIVLTFPKVTRIICHPLSPIKKSQEICQSRQVRGHGFRREFSLFSLAQKMTHMTCLNIVLTFPKVTRIICHPLSPIKKSQEICQSRQVRGHGFRREFSLFSLAQKMTHMTCLNIVLTFPKVTRIICHPLSPIKKSQEICQSRQVRGHGFRREFSLFSLAQKMTHMTCLNIVLTFPKVTRIICHPLSPIKKSQEICQSRQVRGHGFRREFSLFSLAQKMTHMTCLNIVLTFPKVTRIICHPLSPIKKSQEICQSRQVRGHGFSLRIFTFQFSLENDTYDLPKHSTDFP